MKRIGFIGLGIMGVPMSQNLLRAGFQLIVHNRSRRSVDLLKSLGAIAATSPKEVADVSDVVITMLPDSSDVEHVILGNGGVVEGTRPGEVVIDMSTISPAVARKISEELRRRGVRMLDAPVSGGEKGARDATLSIMVGGEKETYLECLTIFQALGQRIAHMGPAGAGQLTKLANQILVGVNMLGVCECLVFAKRMGLDLTAVIGALSAGAASSWSLVNLGPKAATDDFAPGFKVRLLQKDLRLALSTAEESKVALPGIAMVHELYRALEARGAGEEGTQALIRVLQSLSGIDTNSAPSR